MYTRNKIWKSKSITRKKEQKFLETPLKHSWSTLETPLKLPWNASTPILLPMTLQRVLWLQKLLGHGRTDERTEGVTTSLLELLIAAKKGVRVLATLQFKRESRYLQEHQDLLLSHNWELIRYTVTTMVISVVPGQLLCLATLVKRPCKIVKLQKTEEVDTDCERRADNQVLDHHEGKIVQQLKFRIGWWNKKHGDNLWLNRNMEAQITRHTIKTKAQSFGNKSSFWWIKKYQETSI